MFEVRPIDSKLIVCVKLGLHGIVAGPWITGATFQNEHPMIDSRAIEWAEGINLWWWSVWPRILVRTMFADSRITHHNSGLR